MIEVGGGFVVRAQIVVFEEVTVILFQLLNTRAFATIEVDPELVSSQIRLLLDQLKQSRLSVWPSNALTLQHRSVRL